MGENLHTMCGSNGKAWYANSPETHVEYFKTGLASNWLLVWLATKCKSCSLYENYSELWLRIYLSRLFEINVDKRQYMNTL